MAYENIQNQSASERKSFSLGDKNDEWAHHEYRRS